MCSPWSISSGRSTNSRNRADKARATLSCRRDGRIRPDGLFFASPSEREHRLRTYRYRRRIFKGRSQSRCDGGPG